MKKFALLLVVVGALAFFRPGLVGFGKHGAFDDQGNPQVLLFTQSGCGASCDKAMQELNSRGVKFQQIKLDNAETISRYKRLGGDGRLPMLAVGNAVAHGYGKGDYASVLAENFGDGALTRAERRLFAHHFNAQGKPLVYMYGATWCGYCKELRAEMQRLHIEFVEVDVDRNPDRSFIEHVMDLPDFPVVYVGYERIVGGGKVVDVLQALKTGGRHKD